MANPSDLAVSGVRIAHIVGWVLVFAIFGHEANAFECFTVADGGNLLISVDQSNADETLIGSTSPATGVEAVALDPSTGILYGANSNRLGTLNQVTGAFTALANPFGTGDGSLGSISFGDVDGLSFSASTGTLYGSVRRSGSDLLIVVNPNTGAHVADAFGTGVDYLVISVSGSGFNEIDDLASDPVDDTLYAVANTGNGANAKLVSINLSTGTAADIGDLETSGGSPVADMEGLGITPDRILFGTTGTSGPASTDNRLWVIDRTNGETTEIGTLTLGTDYEAFDCNSELPSTPTPTSTHTEIPTQTPTQTSTATDTATATATDTLTPVPTDTRTPTSTNTATHTDTPVPTSTSTATHTDTPVPTSTPTATHTDTPVPTSTPTATHTDTPVPTSTATNTAVPTDTVTNTPTATHTPTATATPEDTATSTSTPTETTVPTETSTPTATFTPVLCGNGVVDAGEACDDGNGFGGDGCENGCTLSVECTFAHGGTATEVYVNDTTGNDGTAAAGCAGSTFSTIQLAIDDPGVSDGDIIWVCPGTYPESVTVSKEVSIRSSDGAAVTTVSSGDKAFDVQRSGVAIEGLTIDAPAGTGVSADSICPLGSSSCATPGSGSNVTITGNIIAGASIAVGWSRKVDCALISNNTMTGNGVHIDLTQQEGAPAVLTGIETNTISGGGSSGAAVNLSGNGPLVLGNTIDGAASAGITLADMAPGARLRENNLYNSGGAGVRVLPGAALTLIVRNNFEGNAVGLQNEAPESVVNATENWWDSDTGPLHSPDRLLAEGDEIVETAGGLETAFIEFLCAPAPSGSKSQGGMCLEGEITSLDQIAFGRSPDVSPNGRFITFVSERDENGDERISIDNADGSDEIFRLNRKPSGQSGSTCLGGSTPGAPCQKQGDCEGDLDADPIQLNGVCIVLTQLTNDVSGMGLSEAPRPTRKGDVFFSTDADLKGGNGDGSIEVHSWVRRNFRRANHPLDPNDVVFQLSDSPLTSRAVEPDRSGRRIVMESEGDPLGTNPEANTEVFRLDTRKDEWSQVTVSGTGVANLRPSIHSRNLLVFDSTGDYDAGRNGDGNREIFMARYRKDAWEFQQITDTTPPVENRVGRIANRGKTIVFSSNADFSDFPGSTNDNSDGNREIFLWKRPKKDTNEPFEQVTFSTVGENVSPYANPRGRFVVFESTADVESGGTLVTNRRVHLWDDKTGVISPVSDSFFGDNFRPRISQGRFVVWESTANLLGSNAAGAPVIYLFDRRKDD